MDNTSFDLYKQAPALVDNILATTFLTELGCNTLQGYLLGKPITAQAIMEQCQHGEMSPPRAQS